MALQLNQRIIPSEDPSDTSSPIMVTQYTTNRQGGNSELSSLVRSATVNSFHSGEEVVLWLNPERENSLKQLQSALQEAGFENTHETINNSQQRLALRPSAEVKKPIMVTLAMKLGQLPESQGGMSPALASQIMDAELERTHISASQAGLTTLKEQAIEPKQGITRHTTPLRYLDAEITNPLSAVTLLAQNSRTTPEGATSESVRIGFRDGKSATKIREALERKNITFSAQPDSKGNLSDFFAQAPLSVVAHALADEGVLLKAIAQEIGTEKAKQRAGGASPPSGAVR